MKSKDYEYIPPEGDYKISENRKQELIKLINNQVRKGFIAHHQILNIGQTDEELDFLYDWLDNNNIEIRGINGTISGEIDNYTHIPKMGQSFMPETLDDAEQERLFWELNSFSPQDIQNKNPKYVKTREKLIERNMRLAKWVASWKGITKIPMSLEDKHQLAYLGLISAVDHFDPSLGFKFSTYATKAIYRRIIREAYREDESTKQNITANEQLAMMKEIKDQIFLNLHREATYSEIADILGISTDKVKELETLMALQEKDSLEQIEEDKKDQETIYGDLSDSDTIVKVDDGYIQDGVYLDEEEALPVGFRKSDRTEDKAMVHSLQLLVEQVLSTLTPREDLVLMVKNQKHETL